MFNFNMNWFLEEEVTKLMYTLTRRSQHFIREWINPLMFQRKSWDVVKVDELHYQSGLHLVMFIFWMSDLVLIFSYHWEFLNVLSHDDGTKIILRGFYIKTGFEAFCLQLTSIKKSFLIGPFEEWTFLFNLVWRSTWIQITRSKYN